MERREILKTLGLATAGIGLSRSFTFSKEKPASGPFRFCLNTSTIRGQQPGLKKTIEIAAQAGYDGLELWVQEVKEFKTNGGSLGALKKLLDDSHLVVEDAI